MNPSEVPTYTTLNDQKSPDGVYEPAPPPSPPRPRRKFLRVFIMIVACLAFWKVARHAIRFGRSQGCHGLIRGGSLKTYDAWHFPPGVDIDHCYELSGAGPLHYKAGFTPMNASFELPISSDQLFLLSRGSFSGGVLHVVNSDEVGDIAKVEVTVDDYSRVDLDQTRVCLIKRNEGQNGVGIFTRDRLGPGRHRFSHLNVVVRIPASSEESPLHINDFETDMPLFNHKIGDLGDAVYFDSLTLETSNMPISVESLSAGTASLTTSNGPIEGSFNTSSSLTLVTSNSHIKVDVALLNDDPDKFTNLKMVTSNAPLAASISLLSESKADGQFEVIAKTSLSNLDLSFPDSPVNSTLIVDARTSLSPATVSLDRAYEGTFYLRSSLVRPEVEYNDEVEDPAGKDRHRKVDIVSYRRNSLQGSVSWDSSKEVKSKGSVHVVTSLSPIVLKL